MGASTDIAIVYGIDLGGMDDEWHFTSEVDDPNGDGVDDLLEMWFLEYANKPELEYGFQAKKYTKLDTDYYGSTMSGYTGTVLYLSDVPQIRADQWTPRAVHPSDFAINVAVHEPLDKFLAWLEKEKGLVVDPQHRTPTWLVVACYG